MSSLVLSSNVVFPLFCMMALGYFLKEFKFLDTNTVNKMNNIVFKVFIPITVFISIYKTDIRKDWNSSLIIFSLTSILTIFFVSILIVFFLEKDNAKRGVLVQCAFRSNYVLFGLPVAISIYGDGDLGAVSILIAIIVPFFNILAVIILQFCAQKKPSAISIFKSISKNTIILAAIIGILCSFINIPPLIAKPLIDLSKVSTPLALVLLGGCFSFSSIRPNIKGIFIGTALKLLIFPLIFLPIAIFLGFRNIELVALMTMFQ